MTNTSVAIASVPLLEAREDSAPLAQTRSSFLQLQSLVAVILSYQVLFSQRSIFTGEAQLAVVLGLLLSCAAIMVLPQTWLGAAWFPGSLALIDTGLTSALIYVTGDLSSEFYIAFFAILLLTTMSRTQKQMLVCAVLVFGVYGLVLYQESRSSGILLEHHLLRLPLLLVMATFYARTIGHARTLTEIDTMTGLPNHRKFLTMVDESLSRARTAKDTVAVLYLSIEGVKLVTDALGHGAGDQLLKAVARRLGQGEEQGYTLARESGHDFALLIEHVTSPRQCADVAQAILRSLELPFSLGSREIFISATIGIALFPQDAEDAEKLVRNADAAMSRARKQAHHTYQFYSPDIHVEAFQHLELAENLRKALERDELRMFYQPQVNISTDTIVGFEALLRWQHPEMGLVSPQHFIAMAEETGLIVPIGQHMLRRTCTHLKGWHNMLGPRFRVSFNLSARQLAEANLVKQVAQVLEDLQLDPLCLEVELTESLLLRDDHSTLNVLRDLKQLGVQLAIDDFGTGYSALSYLQRFPIDTIKIDQSFVRELTSNPEAKAIIKAMIEMAQALNLKVIAEGVELDEQIEFLRQEGCFECQGYAFGRPLPPGEVTDLLRRTGGVFRRSSREL